MNKKQKRKLIKRVARFLDTHKDINGKGIQEWRIRKALKISSKNMSALHGPNCDLSHYLDESIDVTLTWRNGKKKDKHGDCFCWRRRMFPRP